MTKEKLTNGKYWLVIAKYPFPGFETYTLIKSDKDPEYYYKFNKSKDYSDLDVSEPDYDLTK